MAISSHHVATTIPNYTESTFTPTVTLVGGAGNTVPVFTTNTGRYTRIGNRAEVEILLDSDGGNEGAGTGQLNVALPLTASANHPASPFIAGYFKNNILEGVVYGTISGGATTIALSYFNLIGTTVAITGADQNNATRTIRLKFSYEL